MCFRRANDLDFLQMAGMQCKGDISRDNRQKAAVFALIPFSSFFFSLASPRAPVFQPEKEVGNFPGETGRRRCIDGCPRTKEACYPIQDNIQLAPIRRGQAKIIADQNNSQFLAN